MAGFGDDYASVREKNLERTLKDLKCMKGNNSKGALAVNSFDNSCTPKSVRFNNICEYACNLPQSCLDERVNVPLWMGTERSCLSDCNIECNNGESSNVRKSNSEGCWDTNKTATSTSKFFCKLKKFWQGIGGKQKQKQFLDNCDSRYSESSKSTDSFYNYESDATDCETLPETNDQFLNSKYLVNNNMGEEATQTSYDQFNEDVCLEDFHGEEEELEALDSAGVWEINISSKESSLNKPSKSLYDMSLKTMKPFWEPRDGLHDDDDNTACDKTLEQNECASLDEQTSTETLVAVNEFCKSTTLSEENNEYTAFLNYKTSPICCSLESTSTSCQECESDTKRAIRELKGEIALRKKIQRMELNKLKEEMRSLKRHRKKKSSSSSCTLSSTTADCCSFKNYNMNTRSSQSNAACSIFSVRSSNECIRTVLNGHPCRSIPHRSYRSCAFYKRHAPNYYSNYGQGETSSSKRSHHFTHQPHSVENQMWPEPDSNQLKSEKSYLQTSKNCCGGEPDDFYSCSALNLENKISASDGDPTNQLWNEILINTPCEPSIENDSIITCYVQMYRHQAAEALKKREGCCIDPLDFRYGYPNRKRGNGAVNTYEKGGAEVLWTANPRFSKPSLTSHSTKSESTGDDDNQEDSQES